MMSTSFRIEYRQRKASYRTPSPPREAYELLSPVEFLRSSTGKENLTSRKKRKIQQAHKNHSHLADTTNGWSKSHPNNGEYTKRQSVEDRYSQRYPGTNNHFHDSQSPLDVFATVATSPDLGGGTFSHFEHRSPAFEPLFSNEPQLPYTVNGEHHPLDPYKKRPSSGIFDTRSFTQDASRSVTSNSNHNIPASHTAMEDAELLLSFAKAAQPRGSDNHYSRPLIRQFGSSLIVTETKLDDIPSTIPQVEPAQYSRPSTERNLSHGESREELSGENALDIVERSNRRSTEIEIENQDSHLHIMPTNLIADTQVERFHDTDFKVPQDGVHEHVQGAPNELSNFPPSDELHDQLQDTKTILLANQSQLPSTEQSNIVLSTTPEPRQRVYKGWPKGKPRGPRQVPYAKRGTRRVPKQPSIPNTASPGTSTLADRSVEGMFTWSTGSASGGLLTSSSQIVDDREYREAERRRSHSLGRIDDRMSEWQDIEDDRRCRSVPPDVPMVVREVIEAKKYSTRSDGPHTKASASPVNLCSACNLTKNGTNGYHDVWIACNACEKWYHHTCVGFKTEREVRDVDKFYCKACQPIHGPTTFVRKSSRAHASVDYAGLHEGKIRTATDIPDHHYIKAFMEGTIQFLPESFPRMRAELVTADFFEKCSSFSEPVVIPAWMNLQSPYAAVDSQGSSTVDADHPQQVSRNDQNEEFFSRDFEYDCVPDNGQDKLDMVIPRGLTVRRVAELYGPDEKVEVIDVKSQEGEDKRWNMRQWADYYEATGEKPVRNVISLEVSQSKLGRLIQRPKVVRDLDLQDSVWPGEDTAKGIYPKVQFYCLMSVANCYTDFHIDFGGSSVYYHILKGRKTFFFIPPKKQHLKKYEEWCLSSNQGSTFLGDETKECYRVDLTDGDTMLIPSGWIHAVWTPVDTLVIGGNFLTRMHYGMQIQINEIEKNTGVARKFRYPYFQKVMWCAVVRYLERDPVPSTVAQRLLSGQTFERKTPVYYDFDMTENEDGESPELYNERYYSQGEIEGLSDLLRFIFRTVLISLGKIQGVPKTTQDSVMRSMPKGYGEHLDIAQTFAMWVAWKRGNEEIPSWAYPDAVIAEEELANGEKKISAAAIKRLERQAAHEAFLMASGRRSSARQAPKDTCSNVASPKASDMTTAQSPAADTPPPRSKPSTSTPRRPACDACRKRRIRCKHKEIGEELPTIADRFGIKQFVPSGTTTNPRADTVSDTVVKVEVGSPTQPASSRRSTLVAVVINNPESPSQASASPTRPPISGLLPNLDHVVTSDSAPNVGLGIELSAMQKRARTRACDECRKSKRRCIHDENGQIDPVKAHETTTPRNQPGLKRSRNDGDAIRHSQKKFKLESLDLHNLLDEHEVDPISLDAIVHDQGLSLGDSIIRRIVNVENPKVSDMTMYDPAHPIVLEGDTADTFMFDDEEYLDPSTLYRPDMPILTFTDRNMHDENFDNDPLTENAGDMLRVVAREPVPTLNAEPIQYDVQQLNEPLHAKINPVTIELEEDNTPALDTVVAPLIGVVRESQEEPSTASPPDAQPTTTTTATSNGSITTLSDSLPSTPPMSPLTELESSPPPAEQIPLISSERDGDATFIKTENVSTSPPTPVVLRQTPRQRTQVQRFSDIKTPVAEAIPAIRPSSAAPTATAKNSHQKKPSRTSRQPSAASVSPHTNSTNTVAKHSPAATASVSTGRKRGASRSASMEVSGTTVGAATSALQTSIMTNGVGIKTEAEKRDEEDSRLARELSGLDFSLRRRSK